MEAPEELEPVEGLYVAGVTAPVGVRACGDEFREKLRDCRREELALLFVTMLSRLFPLRPCGLRERAASGLTVRIVLLYGFGYTENLEKRLFRIAISASLPWRTVGDGAAKESSSFVGPVITSCSSFSSQLWALPALGALRLPLSGARLAELRLVVCILMSFDTGCALPLGGCDCRADGLPAGDVLDAACGLTGESPTRDRLREKVSLRLE